MPKKFLFFAGALSLLFLIPVTGHAAECTVDNTTGDSSTSETCSDVKNLNREVDLQASAGVHLWAGGQDSDGSDNGASSVPVNDIGVAACHTDGSAGYFGDSGGGSIQEDSDLGAGNCSTSYTYDAASS